MFSFEEVFWKNYPRKVGKFKAEKIWLKMTPGERFGAIEGLKFWKRSLQWQTMEFVPYASTFLAQKRYLDEPWPHAFDEAREKSLG